MKAPTNKYILYGVRFRPPAKRSRADSFQGGEKMVYTFKCDPARVVVIRFGGRVWTFPNKAARAFFG